MAKRTLTEAEVALVLRWTRWQRIWFWILLPVGLGTSAGLLAFGVSRFLAHDWLAGFATSVVGPLVGLTFYLWRGSIQKYRKVSCSTPVVTKSGVLRLKRGGKTTYTCLDDLAVLFFSRDVRRAVKLDEPCVLEVVENAPVLVITARPITPDAATTAP
ncbi:MAG: hypothetical protein M4D80_34745 [Myxococcota bacterium]|nr:hypothetical protein [Myxococcota bacterium]